MGISLKKITEMVVAQTLQGDEHLFLQIGAAFQEVPLPILAAAITRTVGFPKSADDLSAEYAAALEEDADLTPKEFLLTLPAGNYLLPVQLEDDEVETYQLTAMQGSDGNTTRVIMTSGAETSIELFSTAYSESDPLFAVDGESGELLLKGEAVATRANIEDALRGLGIPIVKEAPESAELAGNTYYASGDNFPTVVPADQTPDHRPVGKGSQIVFIPEHNNTGTDPMLTLNDGVSVPIRQRAAIDTQTADNTVQIAKDTLIQGMPYTLTFCGVAWLIDSYLPGEGAETTAKVTSVNGKTGRVNITADGIGAALKAYNWQSAKRGFDIYLENVEEITPEDYMWLLGQGLFYLRAEDGQHFMIRSDMGAMVEAVEGEEGEEGTPAHRDGPAVRAYLFIPLEEDEESTISGGVWMGETKIIAVNSLEDLTSLSFLINDSKIVTEQALLTRLSGYVTNAALLLTLADYAPLNEPQFRSFIDINTVAKAATKTRIFPNKIKLYSGAASATISSSFHNENNLLNVSGTQEEENIIIRGINTPVANNDAAPKSYVDAVFMAAADGRLFRAEYGETSFADIEEAFNAGKLIYMSYQDILLFCRTCRQGIAFFSAASTDYFVEVAVQGTNSVTNWSRVVDGYVESKSNKVNSLNASATHNQYPSAKATYNAIKELKDITSWKDITEEWNAYRDDNDGSTFVVAARAFIKTLDDGRYTFSGEDAVVHAHLITVGGENNAAQYRFIWFALPDSNVPTFEYYKGDTRILGTSSPDGVLRLTVLGKTVVYKDEFLSAMAGVPSRESVSAEMRQKINAVTQTYNAMSVVRTRLQKFANMKHTIRVEIENARMLLDEEDVILQLWVCSRKHGTAHHWWHPSQPGSPTKTSPIGYAMIAGDAIYPNRPLEDDKFPAVPAWMPNNGHMLTEIPVTHQDLVNGYVDIDCSTYFLPMIKPRSTVWRYKAVGLMFTQRTKDVYKRYSVPVTWTVGVLRDGQYKTVGSYANIAKIGIPRGFNGTVVDGTTKKKTIKALHISIT